MGTSDQGAPTSLREGRRYRWNTPENSTADGEDELACEPSQSQQTADVDIHAVGESSLKATPVANSSPRSRTTHPTGPDGPGHLSLAEKTKLLKISCKHGCKLLRCPTPGKRIEEEVWTSIMEEFSATVREGVFAAYGQVKRANNRICNNRRRRSQGATLPRRRARTGDLDTWIDRWVRIWKIRDLLARMADFHQSIYETMGEQKLRRIFRNRIAGTELPRELGTLTLSAPLWKAIQKQIRSVERSLRSRRYSLYPGEIESDLTDGDESEDDAAAEAVGETPLQSIEEDAPIPLPSSSSSLSSPSPTMPENGISTGSPDTEGESELPDPSPRTQRRLWELEHDYLETLKTHRAITGKQISIVDLSERGIGRRRQTSRFASSPTLPRLFGNDTARPRSEGGNEGRRLPSLRFETSGLERELRSENDVRTGGGLGPTRPRRLRPGTYSAGESIQVGWHLRQIPLAGVNDTAEKDYRQSVSATFGGNGNINFRLRAQNMRGEPVPSHLRLKGIISVSHKDIVYHPGFTGMSYGEIRSEVARQSLLATDQRTAGRRVPTPPSESSNNNNGAEPDTRPLHDVYAVSSTRDRGTEAGKGGVDRDGATASSSQGRQPGLPGSSNEARAREGLGIPSHTGARVGGPGSSILETRGETSSVAPFPKTPKPPSSQPNRPKQKSKGPASSKTDRPETTSRKRLGNRVGKQRQPLAPVSTSNLSSPPRRPNPRSRRVLGANRITPSRFYGPWLPKHKTDTTDTNGQGAGWQRNTEHHMPESSRRTTPPQPYAPTATATLEQDRSDDDSLPDIAELCRRRAKVAEGVAGEVAGASGGSYAPPEQQESPATLRNPSDGTLVVAEQKGSAVQTVSRTRASGHGSAPAGGHLRHAENLSGPLGGPGLGLGPGPGLDLQESRVEGSGTDFQPGPKSRKRTRRPSKPRSSSKLPGGLGTGFFESVALPESQEQASSSVSHQRSAKRRKVPSECSKHAATGSSPIPEASDLADRGTPMLDSGLNTTITPNPSGRVTPYAELGDSGDGLARDYEGKVSRPRGQNDPDLTPVAGNNHAPGPSTSASLAPPTTSLGWDNGPKKTKPRTGRNGQRWRHKKQESHQRRQRERPQNKDKSRYRQGPRELDRQAHAGDSSKRMSREMTTDTVDFDRYSLDNKCDYLWRRFSRMEERFRKMEKGD